MKYFKFLLFIVITGVTINSYSQDFDKTKQIDSLLQYYTDNYDFSGCILVAKSGEIQYNKGFGYADYELKTRNKPTTVFRIASITKSFIAILILQFIEEGKLEFNKSLFDYIPEIGDDGKKITIYHLMNHRSGIRGYYKDYPSDDSKHESKLTTIKKAFGLGLEFEPGTQREYRDINYYILGVVIERITGKPLEIVLSERILDKANMQYTQMDDGEEIIENRNIGHYANPFNKGTTYYHPFLMDIGEAFACGDMSSTTEDLLKFEQSLYSNNILSKDYTKYLKVYGWGIDTITLNDQNIRIMSADGISVGSCSNILRIGNNDYSIVMLCNMYTAKQFYWKIPHQILKLLYNEPIDYPLIPIKKYLLNNLTNDTNADKLIELYNSVKENSQDKYIFNDLQLNTIAYKYLDNKDFDNARNIFELNLKEYSDSWIANDGIGEYYYRLGEREKALKYFKISVKLNPNRVRQERKLYRLRTEIIEIIEI
jgi:CubicO group peptidase (beta-lactamase class C family)